ncbi:type II toxin-antitoxin system RatA family toxin [Cocleimonas sp. KMM 6892]|uniref:type II toxin-antitoxin system RatA family toxin n=1 Tax=unclassified Cocleimonas TaxID=2639732 RepID=UPI002DBE3E33|nr:MULTISPECIES: type II toxin-antitoxin system RatA family toxin [unclassified Cocleimonas]MEB8430713.1 type II toxin-antitoxin system RatA family toxin [Cocleimonas sp. KMM 6892]MEC4714515.1 type II toxin-antitoxin system RatA family toxin [Cocleimonas sp. KMM 6895]MEC4743848.1 type II toxin-antitoxin system RatA family toxin [Cocleimonas sp. KMM 6896]
MSQVNKSALVPYSAEQMYKLVDDVSSYQQFLPWCGSSEEISREGNTVVGSVTISKGSVKKSFTTKNILTENQQIEMTLVDGPFKKLHGFWSFKELKPGACKVSLDLEYEFSSKILSVVVGPVFNQVANTMVDSFVKQAKVVYG